VINLPAWPSPATGAIGHLLGVLYADSSTSSTFSSYTLPSGWLTAGVVSSNRQGILLWRRIDAAYAATAPTTITVTSNSNERSAHQAFRIAPSTGSLWVGFTPPGAQPNTLTTSSATDPAAVTGTWGDLRGVWGTRDLLCIAGTWGTATTYPTTEPSGYGNFVLSDSGGTGTSHAYVATARRTVNASSENPGAFSGGGSLSGGTANLLFMEYTPSGFGGTVTLNGSPVTGAEISLLQSNDGFVMARPYNTTGSASNWPPQPYITDASGNWSAEPTEASDGMEYLAVARWNDSGTLYTAPAYPYLEP
jgi:hypothetical protein